MLLSEIDYFFKKFALVKFKNNFLNPRFKNVVKQRKGKENEN